jgi:predicted nucleotidyltransferase
VKGGYVLGSDADVLVILEVDPRPFMERIPEFRRRFLNVPIDVKVLACTGDETAKRRGDPGSFTHSVMAGPIEFLA